MNRLLSLDGGGIRGVFTLEILRRVEALLKERYHKPDLVLADYFNFIGGTSTGAIIASLLAMGKRVAEVQELYSKLGIYAFQQTQGLPALRTKYQAIPVRKTLRTLFREADGRPAILGSEQLRSFLLIVLRNATTGSTWPLTNNPDAIYNVREEGRTSNLDLYLWQLVRASTAAPTLYSSETVLLRDSAGRNKTYEFIDGGVGPHGNPSVMMYLQATLPQYKMNLSAGARNLYILSIGTGNLAEVYPPGQMTRINRVGGAIRMLRSLLSAINEEQDLICRAIGQCIYGPPIDRELGDLSLPLDSERADARFLYCRYDQKFSEQDCRRARQEFASRNPLALDDIRSVPLIKELGAKYANEEVRPEHLPKAALLTQRLVKF
jgi:hypothetical protein